MPGTIPIVGDLLQLRTTCRADEQIAQNVLHYAVEAVIAGGLSLIQIAEQFAAVAAPAYKTWMPTDAVWETISAQNLMPPITDPRVTGNGAGAGQAIGILIPRQVSGIISTLTGFGGRANRGRIYVGFLAGSLLDPDGDLSGAGTGVLQGIADTLGPTRMLTVGGTSTTLRLTVRHPNAPAPPGTPTWTPVTVLTAQGKTATQRRRGDFGRPN